MLVQYSSKLIIWYFNRQNASSDFAKRVANLAGPVSDFRILLRYYGLIPLIKWIIDSEKNPDPNPRLQALSRMQNIANIFYYPLEHAYWLSLHHVIPMTDQTRDKVGMWSCRFWCAYVVLYFAQLFEEKRVLDLKQKTLSKKKDEKLSLELAKIKQQRKDWSMNALINAAYFPLTIHWSLEQSSFPDVAVGVCGTIAAIAQVHLAWRAA
jgi:hypothetical protein